MWPVTPFEPASCATFSFFSYCLYWATCCQSSSTASTLPAWRAWYTGISAICVISTLHLSFDSSTFLTTYTLAVEPTHEFSLSVTVPHDALLAAALVDGADERGSDGSDR